jgi:uncharacterized protein YndB with AHSA1/START domain
MTAADGELVQVDGGWQLRFVRTLQHPREKVWRAITEPEHMRAWFPDEMHGERAVGASLHFQSRDMPDAESFDGQMVVFDPPSVMEFTWGTDRLRFELVANAAGGTVLTLTDTIDELGKAARDGAGWHACLDLLEVSLAGDQPAWTAADRWNDVHPGYVERFGAAASTIGPPQEWVEAEGQ